jgi:EmrB/QacA subfamily drug resistance transporter
MPDGVTSSSGVKSRVWTIALTSVGFFMVVLDTLVVITALPSIHRDLGGDLGTLQWTVTAYALAFGAGVLPAAAIADRFGRRRVYAIGLGLFTTASAACALAPNTGALIAARSFQGLGAAIVTPLSLTILTSAFPADRRGAIIGVWGGVAGLAVAAGPLVGGAVTQGLSWHWIFWVNVPIGVVAVVGACLRLEESYGPKTRLDLLALVLAAGGIGGLTWGLVRSSQAGWGSAEVVLAFTMGALLILAFVLWETRAPQPMVPLSMFRNLTFSAAVGTGFLLAASLISAPFLASQFFQFGLGFSPLSTGLRFLPWTATPLVVAPLAGAISDKIGSRPLMVSGLLLQAGGLFWVSRIASGSVDYTHLIPPFIIAGIGISMAIPSTSTAALNAVPPQQIGKASGIFNSLRQFGAVFGVAIVTAIFSANGRLTTRTAVSNGFKPAFAVSALFAVVGAVCALGVRRVARATAPGVSLKEPVSRGVTAAPRLAND